MVVAGQVVEKKGSDGDKKGSSKDTVFCCENPEKRTSSDIIEL